jgi:TolB-like protein
MSSAESTPPERRPSVFISYASEDREAARRLRETLTAGGLDVWYDEEELTGGDAWDQKIRRQIRDCEYFMPVISATTEARREGYFRREWRLACERSLDMADDVLFIVPVVIDDTAETAARVPDKFQTVQWLRVPGGHATPALHHLVRRLHAGDHHALPRPSSASRAGSVTAPPMAIPPIHAAPENSDDAPPPMPPFPHPPEKGGFGHTLRFLAESLWWLLTAGWLLFKRLPRWARTIIIIWAVVTLFATRCSNNNIHIGDPTQPQQPQQQRPPPPRSEKQKAARANIEKMVRGPNGERRNLSGVDLAKLGAEIARSIAAGERDGAGKPLVVIPFGSATAEDAAEKFAGNVFASLYGQLVLTRGDDVALSAEPFATTADADLVARGRKLEAEFVLSAAVSGEGADRALAVRLLQVSDGAVRWTESYSLAGAEPTAVAEKIAAAVIRTLPAKKP